jgi:hypothetical protein
MLLPGAGLGRSGNVLIKQIEDQSRCSCSIFLSNCVELTIRQVAVKSMLVYASDQAGEAMETKSKVSPWTRTYLILLVTPDVTICRVYGVNL